MKVVIGGVGTRGDVQPLLLLGRALGARGHDVLVCGPPDFVLLAAQFGAEYMPFGVAFKDVLAEIQTVAERNPLPIFLGEIGRRLVREQIEAIGPRLSGADILVGSFTLPSGASLAEAAGIPYMKSLLQPVALRSAQFPPFFVSKQDLPSWFNLRMWDLADWLLNTAFRKLLNDARRQMGLAAIADLSGHVWETSDFLVAVDPALTGPVLDWPFPHRITGFWQARDTEADLPEDVEAFLAAGPPPIYIGFGSMWAEDPIRRTRIVCEAVRQTGERALLSSGGADLGRGLDLPPEVKVLGPVSHAALFPGCKLIVHHGGAGTTAAAALSGRPQVVVPHLLDQHYWAQRVVQTGLGPRPCTVRRLTPGRLAEALRQACGVPAYRERAEAVSQALWARDGLAEACQAIEAKVEGARQAPGRPSGRTSGEA